MEKAILDEVLRKHSLWLDGDGDGERANLSSANLRYANLSSANLRYANLSSASLSYADLSYASLSSASLSSASLSSANLRYANLSSANLSSANLRWSIGDSKKLKYIQAGVYEIIYSADVMAIGCEQHDIKDWWEFDDNRIITMGSGALVWWKIWKPILKKIIKVSPAEPTGFEDK